MTIPSASAFASIVTQTIRVAYSSDQTVDSAIAANNFTKPLLIAARRELSASDEQHRAQH